MLGDMPGKHLAVSRWKRAAWEFGIPVSKTGVGAIRPRVRIPPSPLRYSLQEPCLRREPRRERGSRRLPCAPPGAGNPLLAVACRCTRTHAGCAVGICAGVCSAPPSPGGGKTVGCLMRKHRVGQSRIQSRKETRRTCRFESNRWQGLPLMNLAGPGVIMPLFKKPVGRRPEEGDRVYLLQMSPRGVEWGLKNQAPVWKGGAP